MLKRSFLAIPLVAMLSMSLLTACGDKKEAAAPAKEEKVLRVGTNPTFAPFEFQAKGSNDLTGFDIDWLKHSVNRWVTRLNSLISGSTV